MEIDSALFKKINKKMLDDVDVSVYGSFGLFS